MKKTLYIIIATIITSLIIVALILISKPHRVQRLESYAIMTFDKLRMDIPNYILFSYHFTPNKKETEKINIKRGLIKLNDGTILAHNEPVYKLLISRNVKSKDFYSFAHELEKNDILNLNEDKLKMKVRYIPFSYSLTKQQAKLINSIAEKYKAYNKQGDLYYKPFFTQYSGYKRIYPKGDFLTPFIGHTLKKEVDSITTRKGWEGLESYYEELLSSNKDVILNINPNSQISLQNEVDKMKSNLAVHEVSAITLNLNSGYVDSIASSNRLDLNKQVKKDNYLYLNPSIVQYLFDINLFYQPFEIVVKKNMINKDTFLNSLNNLDYLGFLSLSKLDIEHERKTHTELKDFINGRFKINFMQLVKAYSVFYNEGLIKDFKIAQQNSPISKKQIIDKDLARKIKSTLPNYFKSIEDKKVALEFEDYIKMAKIKFEYFEKNSEKFLKAYFIVEKRKDIDFSMDLIQMEFNKFLTYINRKKLYLEAIKEPRKNRKLIHKYKCMFELFNLQDFGNDTEKEYKKIIERTLLDFDMICSNQKIEQ